MMSNDETDEVIKELFDSLQNRYQNHSDSMKDSGFVFEYVHYCIINVIKKSQLWWIIYRFS